MNEPKNTPLLPRHQSLGARLVDFAGWKMPVQYQGIIEEHRAVREHAGVFDISHMGEFLVRGPAACRFLDSILTNNAAKLGPGQGQYTLLLNDSGGVIDDLILYRTGVGEFLLIVNAAKIAEDEQWIRMQLEEIAGVEFENRSDSHAALAVQGPAAPGIYRHLFGHAMPPRNTIEAVRCPEGAGWAGITGYTGESGFEIFIETKNEDAACGLFDRVLAAGARPCGLGARDTLRLEMCYPLNGSDLDPGHTPLEAGLGFAVDLAKPAFIGREILVRQKAAGPAHKLAAILLEGKAPPPRAHYPVWHDGRPVAQTTSGALSPSLGAGIAMAYLPADLAKPGTPVAIEIRGRRFPARIAGKPFYKKH